MSIKSIFCLKKRKNKPFIHVHFDEVRPAESEISIKSSSTTLDDLDVNEITVELSPLSIDEKETTTPDENSLSNESDLNIQASIDCDNDDSSCSQKQDSEGIKKLLSYSLLGSDSDTEEKICELSRLSSIESIKRNPPEIEGEESGDIQCHAKMVELNLSDISMNLTYASVSSESIATNERKSESKLNLIENIPLVSEERNAELEKSSELPQTMTKEETADIDIIEISQTNKCKFKEESFKVMSPQTNYGNDFKDEIPLINIKKEENIVHEKSLIVDESVLEENVAICNEPDINDIVTKSISFEKSAVVSHCNEAKDNKEKTMFDFESSRDVENAFNIVNPLNQSHFEKFNEMKFIDEYKSQTTENLEEGDCKEYSNKTIKDNNENFQISASIETVNNLPTSDHAEVFQSIISENLENENSLSPIEIESNSEYDFMTTNTISVQSANVNIDAKSVNQIIGDLMEKITQKNEVNSKDCCWGDGVSTIPILSTNKLSCSLAASLANSQIPLNISEIKYNNISNSINTNTEETKEDVTRSKRSFNVLSETFQNENVSHENKAIELHQNSTHSLENLVAEEKICKLQYFPACDSNVICSNSQKEEQGGQNFQLKNLKVHNTGEECEVRKDYSCVSTDMCADYSIDTYKSMKSMNMVKLKELFNNIESDLKIKRIFPELHFFDSQEVIISRNFAPYPVDSEYRCNFELDSQDKNANQKETSSLQCSRYNLAKTILEKTTPKHKKANVYEINTENLLKEIQKIIFDAVNILNKHKDSKKESTEENSDSFSQRYSIQNQNNSSIFSAEKLTPFFNVEDLASTQESASWTSISSDYSDSSSKTYVCQKDSDHHEINSEGTEYFDLRFENLNEQVDDMEYSEPEAIVYNCSLSKPSEQGDIKHLNDDDEEIIAPETNSAFGDTDVHNYHPHELKSFEVPLVGSSLLHENLTSTKLKNQLSITLNPRKKNLFVKCSKRFEVLPSEKVGSSQVTSHDSVSVVTPSVCKNQNKSNFNKYENLKETKTKTSKETQNAQQFSQKAIDDTRLKYLETFNTHKSEAFRPLKQPTRIIHVPQKKNFRLNVNKSKEKKLIHEQLVSQFSKTAKCAKPVKQPPLELIQTTKNSMPL